MKHRRSIWILLALLLFLGAGWLMTSEFASLSPRRRPPKFPSYMRQDEVVRMVNRKHALMLKAWDSATKAQRENIENQRFDPLLVALSAVRTPRTLLIFEIAALEKLPAVQSLLNCMPKKVKDRALKFKDKTGIDPFTSIERAAVAGDMLLLSGDFSGANWGETFSGFQSEPYGKDGMFYSHSGPNDAGPRGSSFLVWKDEMIVSTDDPEMARRVVDLLEGREGFEKEGFPELDTYGQIYGEISVKDAMEALSDSKDDLAKRFGEAISSVKIHVDASEDVVMTAEMSGEDPDRVNDVAKSMGAALSLLRVKARSDEDRNFTELLDYARIHPEGGSFILDLALPLDFIQRSLSNCRTE